MQQTLWGETLCCFSFLFSQSDPAWFTHARLVTANACYPARFLPLTAALHNGASLSRKQCWIGIERRDTKLLTSSCHV